MFLTDHSGSRHQKIQAEASVNTKRRNGLRSRSGEKASSHEAEKGYQVTKRRNGLRSRNGEKASGHEAEKWPQVTKRRKGLRSRSGETVSGHEAEKRPQVTKRRHQKIQAEASVNFPLNSSPQRCSPCLLLSPSESGQCVPHRS